MDDTPGKSLVSIASKCAGTMHKGLHFRRVATRAAGFEPCRGNKFMGAFSLGLTRVTRLTNGLCRFFTLRPVS